MNQDIRLFVSFWDNPKTIKFERRYGLEAIRSLQILWCFAAQEYPHGILEGIDNEDVEIAAKWRGEPGVFIAALLEHGWIDQDEDGTYILHNWEKRQGYVSKAVERSEQSRKAATAMWEKKRGIAENKKQQCSKTEIVKQISKISNAQFDNQLCSQHTNSIADGINQHNDQHTDSYAPLPLPSPLPSPSPDPEDINPHNTLTSVITPVGVDTQQEACELDVSVKAEVKRFQKPTVQEVAFYCKERGNGIDPQTFCDFYEAKGWKIGTTPMKDWRASIRTWERKDFKLVNKNNRTHDSPHFVGDTSEYQAKIEVVDIMSGGN